MNILGKINTNSKVQVKVKVGGYRGFKNEKALEFMVAVCNVRLATNHFVSI